MRWSLLGVVVLSLAGCNRSAPPAVDETTEVAGPRVPAAERDSYLKQLRGNEPRRQKEAAEILAQAAASDPAVIPALIAALKENGNRGSGQVFPNETNSVRDAAVQALLKAGPQGEAALAEQGLPLLLDGLKDPNAPVREHTAVAVGRLGKLGTAAVERLWTLAADPNDHVRTAALDALREIGPPSPLPLVALLDHDDAAIRRDAAGALADFRPYPPQAAEGLAKALAREGLAVRTSATTALAELGPAAAPALPALVARIKSSAAAPKPGETLDLTPLRAIAGIGAPAVAPVTMLLENPEPLVRWQAAYILGEIGSPAKPATTALERALSDQYELVALEAARALARVTGETAKAVELLGRAVKNPDPEVRATGLAVVRRMGSSGRKLIAVMLPLLEDQNEQVRAGTVEYLGMLEPAAVRPVLAILAKRLTSDPSDVVRTRIAEVFEDLGPAAAPVADVLGTAAATDPEPDVRKAAVAALARLGPAGPGGQTGLAKLVADPSADPKLRATAVAALERSEVVLKATADPNPEVRRSATLALGRFTAPAVVTRLGELLADRDPVVRSRALRAVAQLGPDARSLRPAVEKAGTSPIGDQALWVKIALARIDDRAAEGQAAIRAALGSRSPAERFGAIEGLAHFPPDPADLVVLMKLTKDRASAIRRAAILAIGRHGPAAKPTIARLIELLRDRDTDVRLAAIETLGTLGEIATPARAALGAIARTDATLGRTARRSLQQLGFSDDW